MCVHGREVCVCVNVCVWRHDFMYVMYVLMHVDTYIMYVLMYVDTYILYTVAVLGRFR